MAVVSGPAGPWGDWEDLMECIFIDAESFPTLGAAMKEARSWADKVGDSAEPYVVVATGAKKSLMPMHDECEGGYCDDPDCVREHLVWCIPLDIKP